LHHTRWPDQIPFIGWEQGTELDWLRRLVSYWAHEFDWRAWERKLNALDHFTWDGIHFVHQRAASGQGVPLILTHGWPDSFLDYVDILNTWDYCSGWTGKKIIGTCKYLTGTLARNSMRPIAPMATGDGNCLATI
jgi:hypothetical protein